MISTCSYWEGASEEREQQALRKPFAIFGLLGNARTNRSAAISVARNTIFGAALHRNRGQRRRRRAAANAFCNVNDHRCEPRLETDSRDPGEFNAELVALSLQFGIEIPHNLHMVSQEPDRHANDVSDSLLMELLDAVDNIGL